MFFGTLFLLAVVSGFAALILWLITSETDTVEVGLPSFIGAALCTIGSGVAWVGIALYASEDWRYESETVVNPIVVNGTAVVSLDGKVWNLNEKFNRQFIAEDKIIIRKGSTGPYQGVYASEGHYELEVK